LSAKSGRGLTTELGRWVSPGARNPGATCWGQRVDWRAGRYPVGFSWLGRNPHVTCGDVAWDGGSVGAGCPVGFVAGAESSCELRVWPVGQLAGRAPPDARWVFAGGAESVFELLGRARGAASWLADASVPGWLAAGLAGGGSAG